METFEIIKNLINEWFDVPAPVQSPEEKFEDLGFDMLDTLELIINIESLFRIEVDEEHTTNINKWSLGQFCEYIDSLPKVRDEVLYTPEQYFSMHYEFLENEGKDQN